MTRLQGKLQQTGRRGVGAAIHNADGVEVRVAVGCELRRVTDEHLHQAAAEEARAADNSDHFACRAA